MYTGFLGTVISSWCLPDSSRCEMPHSHVILSDITLLPRNLSTTLGTDCINAKDVIDDHSPRIGRPGQIKYRSDLGKEIIHNLYKPKFYEKRGVSSGIH